jgi:TRAP-type C4-dicarboxylate transport system permease small subunit
MKTQYGPGLAAVRRGLHALYLACGWVAGFLLVLICVLMLLMSVGREVGINIRGGDEICGWASTACFALGLAYTFKQGEMVRVGILVERFEGDARRWAEAGCLVIGCILTGWIAWFCSDFVYDAYRFKDVTPGMLVLPLWIVQFPLAFGTTVQFIAFVEQLVITVLGYKPDYAKDPPKTAEEVLERAASQV